MERQSSGAGSVTLPAGAAGHGSMGPMKAVGSTSSSNSDRGSDCEAIRRMIALFGSGGAGLAAGAAACGRMTFFCGEASAFTLNSERSVLTSMHKPTVIAAVAARSGIFSMMNASSTTDLLGPVSPRFGGYPQLGRRVCA